MGDTINWGFFKRHFWGELLRYQQLGSIGFNGKATVVCMGRVRLIPDVLIVGSGAFPAEIDTRLSNWSAPARRRPKIGTYYRWTPWTQRSFLWPSQGACKDTSGRKALSGIGKPPGVPIRLIHCCARRKGGQSLNTKGPLGP